MPGFNGGGLHEGGRGALFELLRLSRTPAASAVAWVLVAAVSGRLATLAMTVVIAPRMGPASYGVFAFATSIVLLGAQLGGLGWPTLVTRMIPKYVQERDWSRLRGLRTSADLVMLVSTIVIGFCFVAFAWLFLDLSNPLYIGMLVAAALVLPTGFRLLHRQELAGINRAAPGIFFDETVAPLFILVACLLWGVSEDTHIYAVYVAGTYCSALVSRMLYRRWANPQEFSAPRIFEFKPWMLISLPMMTAVATRYILDRIDAIMLAPLSSVYEVGLYSISFRIAYLASIVPSMTIALVRPMLARHFEARDHDQAARVMRYYYLFTALAACLISGFLVVFAEPIIRALFGAEFVAAAPVLRLLAVGQVFGALAEASSSYLLMSGKERVFGSLSLVGLAINVLLNVWLIPGLGARGAAIATASTNLLFFVVAAAIVARALKMRRRATSAPGEPRY